jgi:peptidoglycan/LPS O-acetylase OafA/YrhL
VQARPYPYFRFKGWKEFQLPGSGLATFGLVRKLARPTVVTMAVTDERRVFGLDFLRAAAIMSVVLAHGGLTAVLVATVTQLAPSLAPKTIWFGLLSHGGLVGVELFFVLSGFLIGGILLRSAERFVGPRGLVLFYSRRWFRTLPLFWLFVLLNVLLERWLRDRSISPAEVFGHALFLRNFSHISLFFFPESWSLAVEEWFYLLFPAVLWLGCRFTPARFGNIFLACSVLFFLFALTARINGALHPGANWVNGQRCTVIYRFDTLMMGMVAAWIAHAHPNMWRRAAIPAAIIGMLIFLATYAGLWSFHDGGATEAADTFFAKTFRFTCFSLGFALLLPWAAQWKPARESIVHSALRKIALWSYALYLVHWPFFQIMASPFFQRWQETSGPMLLFFCLKIGCAILASA